MARVKIDRNGGIVINTGSSAEKTRADRYRFLGQNTCSGFCIVGRGPFPFDFHVAQSRLGWTAGAGLEWAFWDNSSARSWRGIDSATGRHPGPGRAEIDACHW